MDAEEYRKGVERKILGVIKDELHSAKMNAPRAQAIAAAVLSVLKPPKTPPQVNQLLPQLIEQFPELVYALSPILEEQEEKVKAHVVATVRTLIQAQKFTEAKALITNALNHEVILP